MFSYKVFRPWSGVFRKWAPESEIISLFAFSQFFDPVLILIRFFYSLPFLSCLCPYSLPSHPITSYIFVPVAVPALNFSDKSPTLVDPEKVRAGTACNRYNIIYKALMGCEGTP